MIALITVICQIVLAVMSEIFSAKAAAAAADKAFKIDVAAFMKDVKASLASQVQGMAKASQGAANAFDAADGAAPKDPPKSP